METRKGSIYTMNGSPQSLAATIEQFRQHTSWLPSDQSWWFGWCELEISLPGELNDIAALPTSWPVVHLFSPRMELRWLRRGNSQQAVLLCEEERPAALAMWQPAQPQTYDAYHGQRILWGDRLKHGDATVRGTVELPRPLIYDVAGEKTITNPHHQTLVADVWLYHDAAHRLKTVRYASIGYTTPSNEGT